MRYDSYYIFSPFFSNSSNQFTDLLIHRFVDSPIHKMNVRVVTLGSSNVGKTTLLLHMQHACRSGAQQNDAPFCAESASAGCVPTIGVDLCMIEVDLSSRLQVAPSFAMAPCSSPPSTSPCSSQCSPQPCASCSRAPPCSPCSPCEPPAPRECEEGARVKLNCWDTAGQECFDSISRNYYRNADAVLLVYDVSDASTLEKAEQWYAQICDDDPLIPIVLVGNKMDLLVDSRSYGDTSDAGDACASSSVVSERARQFCVRQSIQNHIVVSARPRPRRGGSGSGCAGSRERAKEETQRIREIAIRTATLARESWHRRHFGLDGVDDDDSPRRRDSRSFSLDMMYSSHGSQDSHSQASPHGRWWKTRGSWIAGRVAGLNRESREQTSSTNAARACCTS